MRDLGILMDSKLKFYMHTDSVVNKAYRVLTNLLNAIVEYAMTRSMKIN